MVHLRIELQLPGSFWLARLSREFRSTTFWVIAFQRLRSGATVALLSGTGWTPGAVQRQLDRDPDVDRVRPLERTATHTLLQVYYHRPVLVPILEETGLLPRFPFAVRDGIAYWELLGVERASTGVIRRLEERLPESRVRSVFSSRAYPAGAYLTARQEYVYRRAIALGYYAYPRRLTLTELARSLEVSKGSLSVMLRRIEAALADQWWSIASLPRPWVPPAEPPRPGRRGARSR